LTSNGLPDTPPSPPGSISQHAHCYYLPLPATTCYRRQPLAHAVRCQLAFVRRRPRRQRRPPGLDVALRVGETLSPRGGSFARGPQLPRFRSPPHGGRGQGHPGGALPRALGWWLRVGREDRPSSPDSVCDRFRPRSAGTDGLGRLEVARPTSGALGVGPRGRWVAYHDNGQVESVRTLRLAQGGPKAPATRVRDGSEVVESGRWVGAR